MDAAGQVLARKRLPEGVAGMARLHALIGQQLGEGAEDAEVVIGIETDRGPWVAALVATGYVVYAVNPLQASRYRERHGVSGARSDRGDAHMLADMVRTDSHQLRAVAGASPGAEAVKVVARAHKTLIWERTRQVQRLRHQLREYFPAALAAFEDLDAPDALELLARAPDPARGARLTRAQVSAALKRARRCDFPGKATAIMAALCSDQLGQPPAVTAAYAATVRSLIEVERQQRRRGGKRGILVADQRGERVTKAAEGSGADYRGDHVTRQQPNGWPGSRPGLQPISATHHRRYPSRAERLRNHQLLPAYALIRPRRRCPSAVRASAPDRYSFSGGAAIVTGHGSWPKVQKTSGAGAKAPIPAFSVAPAWNNGPSSQRIPGRTVGGLNAERRRT